MSDTETTAVPAAQPKSEGQLLLDRMLVQCNRFNRIRKRIESVRGSIAPNRAAVQGAAVPEQSGGAPAPVTSFFDALKMLADGNDQVADQLEATVEDLATLF